MRDVRAADSQRRPWVVHPHCTHAEARTYGAPMPQRQADKLNKPAPPKVPPPPSKVPPKVPPKPDKVLPKPVGTDVDELKPVALGRASDEELMRRTQDGDQQAF